MQEDFDQEDNEPTDELIERYQNFKMGISYAYFEEEDYERIIDFYDDKEDLDEALLVTEEGLEQFPFSSQLMLRKADFLLAARKHADALEVLEMVELYDNSNIDLYILKSDALLALDEKEKVAQLLEFAINRFEGDEKVDLLLELSDVYDDYEEFDKIFDCLKLILEEDPNNEEALYKICFWTDHTGRNEESIRLHQKIIDDFPYNEIAWFNLAAAYQGLKLYEKAIDAYQYAVVIDEKFDYAFRNMGDAYLRLRKYDEAIEALSTVLTISSPDIVIYEVIGYCYQKKGNLVEARTNYIKAVLLAPHDAKLQYKVAVTFMLEKNWLSASKYLENALEINKNTLHYNLAMGECLFNLKKTKSAIQYFVAAVNTKPNSPTAWEALIKCLIQSEMLEDALDQCIVAKARTQNKPIFIFYQSAILLLLGMQKEALIHLEDAMEKAPKLVNKFLAIDTAVLNNHLVVDILSRYKKKRRS